MGPRLIQRLIQRPALKPEPDPGLIRGTQKPFGSGRGPQHGG
jgi:hypothetical protein